MPTTVPLGTGEATPQPPWGCVTEFWPRECGVLMLGQEDPQALGWVAAVDGPCLAVEPSRPADHSQQCQE